MSHHTVDVAAALMGVHSSDQTVLTGLYSDSPHAEFSGRAFDSLSKLDFDPVTNGGAILRVCLHAMRKPGGNERDEHHMAADGIPGEAEKGCSFPSPKERGTAGSDHHSPKQKVSLFFHQAANKVPLTHTDSSTGEDCIAFVSGVVESFT